MAEDDVEAGVVLALSAQALETLGNCLALTARVGTRKVVVAIGGVPMSERLDRLLRQARRSFASLHLVDMGAQYAGGVGPCVSTSLRNVLLESNGRLLICHHPAESIALPVWHRAVKTRGSLVVVETDPRLVRPDVGDLVRLSEDNYVVDVGANLPRFNAVCAGLFLVRTGRMRDTLRGDFVEALRRLKIDELRGIRIDGIDQPGGLVCLVRRPDGSIVREDDDQPFFLFPEEEETMVVCWDDEEALFHDVAVSLTDPSDSLTHPSDEPNSTSEDDLTTFPS